MPIPDSRSPDYDPEADYYTEEELSDIRSEKAERQWREEREERSICKKFKLLNQQ